MWNQILETGAEDDDFAAEDDGTSEYTWKFLRAKIEFAEIIDRTNVEIPINNNTGQSNNRTDQDAKKRHKLLKLQL